jgi:hypothetical protein
MTRRAKVDPRAEIEAAKAAVETDLATMIELLDTASADAEQRALDAPDDLAARCHREAAGSAARLKEAEVASAGVRLRELDDRLAAAVPGDGP